VCAGAHTRRIGKTQVTEPAEMRHGRWCHAAFPATTSKALQKCVYGDKCVTISRDETRHTVHRALVSHRAEIRYTSLHVDFDFNNWSRRCGEVLSKCGSVLASATRE
jgi:hypothetical protein